MHLTFTAMLKNGYCYHNYETHYAVIFNTQRRPHTKRLRRVTERIIYIFTPQINISH